jgi:prolyl oligopeptidase
MLLPNRTTIVACGLGGMLTAMSAGALPQSYPPAPAGPVTDVFHGVTVADPYRWLENASASDTQAWIDAQSDLSQRYLQALPQREDVKADLLRIWNHAKYTTPVLRGGRYFYSRNEGLQEQAVLYGQAGLKGKPAAILDPNKLSADNSVTLGKTFFSPDGKWLAYGLIQAGSDTQTYHVRNLAKGTDMPEVLQWCKFTTVAWAKDGKGFYYNRFPTPGTVPAGEENRHKRVYWHQVGTPQSDDPLVYADTADKDLMVVPTVTDDGRQLVLSLGKGAQPPSRILYRETGREGTFVPLLDLPGREAVFIEAASRTAYVLTTAGAPRRRIVAVNLDRPQPEHWRTVVPQTANVIEAAQLVGNRLVVVTQQNASNRIKLFHLDGRFDREVALPALGAVASLTGRPSDQEFCFRFTSFLYPRQQFRYDLRAKRLQAIWPSTVAFDTTPFVTEQVFVTSKDGTRVPMFLVHRKGIKRDGQHPTLLYGYGGFGESVVPFFSLNMLVWLQNGGMFAVANTRGGGEYGETWHEAGTATKRQNVFDDFIAAASWLIDHRYTAPRRLALQGASNGGLLVAASMQQRPDLFGAVACQVPVADMLRFHKFTIGHFWLSEYGNPEMSAEQFQALRAYSPVHNARPGTRYPATLITTSETDDRVVPLHAYKLTAALQTANPDGKPILLRIDRQAGHGGAKVTNKLIEELADMDAFLMEALGMTTRPALPVDRRCR